MRSENQKKNSSVVYKIFGSLFHYFSCFHTRLPAGEAMSNWISTNMERVLPHKHMTLAPARSLYAALPARRMGIFFWSFTSINCTTSAVCRTHTFQHKNTHQPFCLVIAVSVTFCSTCAGVSLSKPLWTWEVLGWVNRESLLSSWTRMEPDCFYMKIKQGKTLSIQLIPPQNQSHINAELVWDGFMASGQWEKTGKTSTQKRSTARMKAQTFLKVWNQTLLFVVSFRM